MKLVLCMAMVLGSMMLASCNLFNKYTVGGVVTGLHGAGLVLQNNSGNNLGFSSNGTFTFSSGVQSNAAYSVTVSTQPSNPAQTCTVHNGTGTIAKLSVTNVIVTCIQAGRFAYVANTTDNTISGYLIDTGGALVPLSGSPFPDAGVSPVAVAVDPNGAYLYVVNNGSNDVSVYTINYTTGALVSNQQPLATGVSPLAIVIDPSDRYLYVANFGGNTISAYTVASSSAVAATIAGSPFAVGSEPSSLGIDPSGNFLYISEYGDADVTGLVIDELTGALTVAGLGLVPIALAYAYAWAVSRMTVYSITNRRVVLHIGLALPVTLNLPLNRVSAADLRAGPDGSGDLSLTLSGADRFAYVVLWPHARPWRFTPAQPTMRGLRDAAAPAQVLSNALGSPVVVESEYSPMQTPLAA